MEERDEWTKKGNEGRDDKEWKGKGDLKMGGLEGMIKGGKGTLHGGEEERDREGNESR